MKDRRQIKRWQISWSAKIKLEGAECFTNCSIHDITLRGLRVCLPHTIRTDAFLKLSIVLCDTCILPDIEAWVAWHKIVNEKNIYGLYFVKVSDLCKEKIYRFMREHFHGQMNKQLWEGLKQEGGEDMEDRRIFQRFSVNLPMSFLDLNSGIECQACAQDVSAKGLGLVVNQEMEAKTPLEMWLKIPDSGEPLYLRGEVVWSKMQGANEYRAGVSLEKADLVGLSRVLRLDN